MGIIENTEEYRLIQNIFIIKELKIWELVRIIAVIQMEATSIQTRRTWLMPRSHLVRLPIYLNW